jgi:hypothetical protein
MARGDIYSQSAIHGTFTESPGQFENFNAAPNTDFEGALDYGETLAKRALGGQFSDMQKQQHVFAKDARAIVNTGKEIDDHLMNADMYYGLNMHRVKTGHIADAPEALSHPEFRVLDNIAERT